MLLIKSRVFRGIECSNWLQVSQHICRRNKNQKNKNWREQSRQFLFIAVRFPATYVVYSVKDISLSFKTTERETTHHPTLHKHINNQNRHDNQD